MTTNTVFYSDKDSDLLHSYMNCMEAPKIMGYTQTWPEWVAQFVKMIRKFERKIDDPKELAEMKKVEGLLVKYPNQAGDWSLDRFADYFSPYVRGERQKGIQQQQ